ncbi:class I SAM-dependent methyltransferase [Desulfovibrio sulfodismutans]|uniref:Class I SAM-dependent methyltransferase n=1 Tax=Desulfolutivibrio sulfodismutans TaxID=63561 RepID=A0A7K3NLP6_9BACT|nr:class I SAM-dependent methyltransferase [Desulfolutivibrio sulfodismutans]NDY56109.1 class I SAM-dependent methyltransferase [Desulfolutivibrio sulfodismutans]
MKCRLLPGCPVCGGAYEFLVLSPDKRRIAVCYECSHVFVADPISPEKLRNYFQGRPAFEGSYAGLTFEDIGNPSRWQSYLYCRMDDLCRGLGGPQELCPQMRIAEVGCLEGRFLAELAAQGHHVVGCDLNEDAVPLGRGHLGLDLRVGTVEECMPMWGCFDLVIALHVLQHCLCPRTELATWVRLLAPGGRLVVHVGLNRDDYESKWCMQYFTERSIRKLMGFFFDKIVFRKHPRPNPDEKDKDIGAVVGYLGPAGAPPPGHDGLIGQQT